MYVFVFCCNIAFYTISYKEQPSFFKHHYIQKYNKKMKVNKNNYKLYRRTMAAKDIIYINSVLLSFSNYIQCICIIAIAIVIKTELLIGTVPEEQTVVLAIPHEGRLKP